eukprot:scaffold28326_cov63-Phaeocystis_antarctica.AAC.6
MVSANAASSRRCLKKSRRFSSTFRDPTPVFSSSEPTRLITGARPSWLKRLAPNASATRSIMVALALCALSTAMLVRPAVRPPALRAPASWRACPVILMAEPAPKPLKMSEKVALVADELGLELDGLKVATAVAAGNDAMGIEGEGPLAAQMQRLLKELGITDALATAEAEEEKEAGAEPDVKAEKEAEKPPGRGANGEVLTGIGYRGAPRPGEPAADAAPIA